MTTTLSDLLPTATSLAAIAVAGVQADSRLVGEGDAFFALPGTQVDGAAYARDAVARGAIAIVTETQLADDPGAPVIVVEDVRSSYARAAAKMAGRMPSRCVGVTGTNGKTSTTSFLRQIWTHAGLPAASLGTLGLTKGETLTPGELTTPDALTLAETLAGLAAEGIEHVALEASSHGIEQRRLDGVPFAAVGFTNLFRDHLDYHGTIEAYRAAKLRLFDTLITPGTTAVINAESADAEAFTFAALDAQATLFTVGEGGAHIEVERIEAYPGGQRVIGKLVGEPLDLSIPLVGRFQVSNALMAAGLALATGVERQAVIEALGTLRGARGRLELAGSRGGGSVFVDYSHKPEALKVVLDTLRQATTGRLIVVFGCGGDRDRGKRPIMGAIATDNADVVIVTDDNPRTEDAGAIRTEILNGAPGALEIGDRAEAIAHAVKMMGEGDTVLVAGKGHEDYQIIGKTKHHFSDHEAVQAAIDA